MQHRIRRLLALFMVSISSLHDGDFEFQRNLNDQQSDAQHRILMKVLVEVILFREIAFQVFAIEFLIAIVFRIHVFLVIS